MGILERAISSTSIKKQDSSQSRTAAAEDGSTFMFFYNPILAVSDGNEDSDDAEDFQPNRELLIGDQTALVRPHLPLVFCV